MPRLTRKGYLHTAAAGGSLLGLNPFLELSPVTAQEVKVTPGLVRFGSG